MVQSREVVYLDDFRGGLNLTTQVQSLRTDESPDTLNMDFGYRGGFVLRGGFQTQDYSALFDGAIFLGASYYGADVVMLAETDGSLCEWDGGTITNKSQDLSDVSMATARVRMATFNSKNYFVNGRLSGNIVSRSWDDSTLTTLTNTFNEDYTTPDQGDMPLARHIASHAGYLWVADTVESGTRYPSRVRFSHLQQPEDWATADYVDCDPSDAGDPITGLHTFQDALLIFKRSGVYAMYGYDKDSFQLERLTDSSGVASCQAMTSNSGVAYWFSSDGELMAFNGRGVAPVTDKLRWWADLGIIKHGGNHVLSWSDSKLWLSLEGGPAATEARLFFVWDSNTKSFTRYNKIVTEMFNWVRIGSDPDPLFLFSGDSNIYRYDRAYSTDTETPDFLTDQTDTPLTTISNEKIHTVDEGSVGNLRINGYYRTGWVTADETATKKRWKRPRVTAAAEGDTTITMKVYHDFDSSTTKKTSEIVIDQTDDAVWGTLLWGGSWPDDVSDVYEFSRQPSAGTGHAVQFEFSSLDNPGRWWVDSIAIPFRRKQVK